MASLNPEFVEAFLESFHVFQESGNEDSRLFLMDLNTAMYNAPLTSLERQVVVRLFIDPPKPPQRDYSSLGRPAGGSTQAALCKELGIAESTISALKQSAIEKMSEWLGSEYEVD
jgi:hypothetical protein